MNELTKSKTTIDDSIALSFSACRGRQASGRVGVGGGKWWQVAEATGGKRWAARCGRAECNKNGGQSARNNGACRWGLVNGRGFSVWAPGSSVGRIFPATPNDRRRIVVLVRMQNRYQSLAFCSDFEKPRETPLTCKMRRGIRASIHKDRMHQFMTILVLSSRMCADWKQIGNKHAHSFANFQAIAYSINTKNSFDLRYPGETCFQNQPFDFVQVSQGTCSL